MTRVNLIQSILFVFISTVCARAQDSTLVAAFCKTLAHFPQVNNLDSAISRLSTDIKAYYERDPEAIDSTQQGFLRFHYRLDVELSKTCPVLHPLDRVFLVPREPVFDLEHRLAEQEVDSLSSMISGINGDHEVYVYIVTVPNYYPDSTIEDFARRYCDYWALPVSPRKGVVMIVFSAAQRGVRVETDDISKGYLTDDECRQVIQVMTPHFKIGEYFQGLADGLEAIGKRL